jgi:hypothetical protein
MLSDTLFDGIHGMLKDVAHYAVDDASQCNREPRYTPEDYDEMIHRMVPILDMQIALDTGCDPMPIDEETVDRLSWRLIETLVDIIAERYGYAG